jgi:hypothetical protein
MTERQWELYRLSVVEPLPESPYKAALIGAIEHKLRTLDAQVAGGAPEEERPLHIGRR